MNAKTNISKLSLAVIGAIAISGSAFAGIAGSKHDLSTSGAAQGGEFVWVFLIVTTQLTLGWWID